MSLDPVLLELLYHKFKSTTEEMGIALGRTARSSYVKETNDFGTALCNLRGKFFACPEVGVALGVDKDCASLIAAEPDLEPGDVLITNHPYLAGGVGSHLPDVNLLKPYFHDGKIICYAWSFLHCSDIGGGVPSSISPSFDSLFQEGLQVPPMKMYSRGKMNEQFHRIFRANSRLPDINDGDMQAMITALSIGEKRVQEIVARHGVDVFMAAQDELVDYARRRALSIQRQIPDGEYVYWDYMDDDFRTRIPVRLRCRMTVNDGQIHLDLTGSDPQLAAPYNVPTGGVRHPYFTAKIMHMLFTYDRTLPLNYGLFENVTVTVPPGTLMNPESPAPVGVRHATAVRFGDVVLGCLSQAKPGMAPAASGGTVIPAVVAQVDSETGKARVSVLQSLAGGGGACPMLDGADGRDRSLANILNTPTERGEVDVKVRIEQYELRPDSGGPGKFRGGTGVIYAIRVLQDETQILGRGLERFAFQPWGAEGGKPGLPARVVLNLGTPQEQELGKIDVVRASAGDLVTIMTPGGGGFGSPLERDIEAVATDLRLGFISAEGARNDYGVVFRNGQDVDVEATAELRGARRNSDSRWGFGEVRQKWEEVFDDESMTALAQALLRVPSGVRNSTRVRTYETIVPGLTKLGAHLMLKPDFDAAKARARLRIATAELCQKWAAA
jgi:N-methylhydantoinase B